MVLMASAKIIRDNPDAVASMIEIMRNSNEFINENWDEDMEICAARTGLSLEDQKRCSAVQSFDVGFNQTDLDSIELAAQAMLAFRNIKSMPTVMDHVELRFLTSI